MLAGANDIFRQIMIRDLGGVEYDDRAALYPGASYPEISDSQADNTPELHSCGYRG